MVDSFASKSFDSASFVKGASVLLDEYRAGDTVALDVRGISSITDFLVICTVSSNAQMRGLVEKLAEYCAEHGVQGRNLHKRPDETGWLLIDCEFVVFHLMTQQLRDFYELERLWFSGETLFSATA